MKLPVFSLFNIVFQITSLAIAATTRNQSLLSHERKHERGSNLHLILKTVVHFLHLMVAVYNKRTTPKPPNTEK